MEDKSALFFNLIGLIAAIGAAAIIGGVIYIILQVIGVL